MMRKERSYWRLFSLVGATKSNQVSLSCNSHSTFISLFRPFLSIASDSSPFVSGCEFRWWWSLCCPSQCDVSSLYMFGDRRLVSSFMLHVAFMLLHPFAFCLSRFCDVFHVTILAIYLVHHTLFPHVLYPSLWCPSRYSIAIHWFCIPASSHFFEEWL